MRQIVRLFLIFGVLLIITVKIVGANSASFIDIGVYKNFPERSYFADKEVFIRPSTPSDLQNSEFRGIIGTGKSVFPGSSKSRLKNIEIAAKRFNGVIVPKGKVFSFNEILKSVHPKYGYVKDAVINGGRIVYEQGGGICQLSTTIFRAALSAGLEMVAQKSHSIAVPYYMPYGLESAIYMPYLDLQFRNNTPGDILIQTMIRGEALYVVFLGISDGRKVSMKGPFYNKFGKTPEDLEPYDTGDSYAKGYDYQRFSVQWLWTVEYPAKRVKQVLTSYYTPSS